MNEPDFSTLTVINLEAAAHRRCGSCSLCCTLLSVPSINKKHGERCRYQRHKDKGCCTVYPALTKIAPECAVWTCRWLTGDSGKTSRPDRVHYVIDGMPDFVTIIDDDGSAQRVPVVQVWVDPGYPEAHRDPNLRAWLDENGHVAIVRYSELDAFLLVPPSRTADHQWHERRDTNVRRGAAHDTVDILRVLAGLNPEAEDDDHELEGHPGRSG
jgi:hypothetical protein